MDKPNLEFICTMPGVEEVMPIIRASEYQHSWIKKAVQDMKTNGSIAAPHRRPFEAPQTMAGQKNTDNEERLSLVFFFTNLTSSIPPKDRIMYFDKEIEYDIMNCKKNGKDSNNHT